MPSPEPNKRYTYADYCKWDDGKRWELIYGVPYEMETGTAMSPAPARVHQKIIAALHLKLGVFLQGKPCTAYFAPFDVKLFSDEENETVVQPDLLVVCDKTKLDDKGMTGAPDFIVEVISPSSARQDRVVKLSLYRDAGVREYWIVDPTEEFVMVNILENGRYFGTAYSDEDVVPVTVLPGCEITLSDVFAE